MDHDLESCSPNSAASLSSTDDTLHDVPSRLDITYQEQASLPHLLSTTKSPEILSAQIRGAAWSYCDVDDEPEIRQRGCPSYEYLLILSLSAYRYELNQLMLENRLDTNNAKRPILSAEYMAKIRETTRGYFEQASLYHRILQYPLDSKTSQDECKRRMKWNEMCPEAPLPPFDRFCKFGYFPAERQGSSPQPKEDPIREFLKITLPRKISFSSTERLTNDGRIRYSKGLPPLSSSNLVDQLARFLLACLSGLALIIPMLIMSVASSSRTISLVTISVSVLLFATFISLLSKSSNQEILVSTATYAAVLMVFVGTSGSGGSYQ